MRRPFALLVVLSLSALYACGSSGDATLDGTNDAGSDNGDSDASGGGFGTGSGSGHDGGITSDASSTKSDGGAKSDGGDKSDDGGNASSSDGGGGQSEGGSADAGGGGLDAGSDSGSVVKSCAIAADCVGANVTCAFDRCVTVSEQTRAMGTKWIDGMGSTYLPGDVHDLFLSYNDSTAGNYSHFAAKGPFMTTPAVTPGMWSSFLYNYVHRPGRGSSVAWVSRPTGSYDQVTFSSFDAGGAIKNDAYAQFGSNASVARLATAINDAGERFIFATVTISVVNQNSRCELQYAHQPVGGSFTVPELVGPCADSQAAIGIITNDKGAPQLITAGASSVTMYQRNTVADPWTTTNPIAVGFDKRPQFTVAQSHDGIAEIMFATIEFTQSASNGDYTVDLYTLANGVVTRDVPLGKYIVQYRNPFVSVDVAADETVTLLRTQPTGSQSYEPIAYRVSPAGVVASRTLGLVPGGAWPMDTLTASSKGELTLVHIADAKTLLLRQLTPVN